MLQFFVFTNFNLKFKLNFGKRLKKCMKHDFQMKASFVQNNALHMMQSIWHYCGYSPSHGKPRRITGKQTENPGFPNILPATGTLIAMSNHFCFHKRLRWLLQIPGPSSAMEKVDIRSGRIEHVQG